MSNKGTITCSLLGLKGRFGNSLFTYCALRGIAERYGYELQINWPQGRLIFDFELPSIDKKTHPIDLDLMLLRGQLDYWLPRLDGKDCFTYGQHQVFLDNYTRTKAKEWLKLSPELLEYEDKFIVPFKEDSVAHLRRGDYVTQYSKNYAIVSDKSYEDATVQFGLSNVFAIEEGWRKPGKDIEDWGIPFLDDFLVLKNANHLLRANSSFSVWSGWLGNGKVYSPVVENKVGWVDVPFVEGNWPRTSGHANQSDLHLKEE